MSEITRSDVKDFMEFVAAHGSCDWDDVTSALIAAWEREQRVCAWTALPSGRWWTGCGRECISDKPGPETGVYRCFHCGGRIEVGAPDVEVPA